MTDPLIIRELDPASSVHALGPLTDILCECVEGGASVSFMSPLPREKAQRFWQQVCASAARGERVVLVAQQGSDILGTVQLVLDQPDNQPHRADVSKLLVSPRARGAGIGQRLMQAVEAAAREHQRTLLVLDTASEEAKRLYARMQWQRVGEIPGYALLPNGEPCATVYFYKQLAS